MLLTSDNLLRFVREKKYVTPTHVAEHFETSTIIASAALSDLAKKKQIGITYLKLSSSPYYYDLLQKQALQDLAEKHFSGIEKELYLKLKEQQLLAEHTLTIPQKVSLEKLKDFTQRLEIQHAGKILVFWVWYLRDLNETKRQILSVLNGDDSPSNQQNKQNSEKKVEPPVKKEVLETSKTVSNSKEEKKEAEPKKVPEFDSPSFSVEKDKVQQFIENYLSKNYLQIEEIDKLSNGIVYSAKLKVNDLIVFFDCMYFFKKPSEAEIVKFYTSSMKSKIVFVENAPKKLFKLVENLENLELVNI